MHLVIAVIDARAPLQAVLTELDRLNLEPDAVELLSAEPLRRRWLQSGSPSDAEGPPLARGDAAFWDWEAILRQRGIPEAPAGLYAEAVRRGATVLVARVRSTWAQTVQARLNRLGLMDIDDHAELWAEDPDYRYPGARSTTDAAAGGAARESLDERPSE